MKFYECKKAVWRGTKAMKQMKTIVSIALILAFFLPLTACETREEGTLEKLGREADDALGDANERNESVADKVGERVRDLGDDIEDRG